MIRTLGICLLLATGAQAQDQDVPDMAIIQTCSTAPIGSALCDREKLSESLGLLAGSEVRDFGFAGMESFAMLTALRYSASAIAFLDYDDPCAAEENRYAAVDIWDLWVKLPEDAPDTVKERYEMYNGIIENIRNMEIDC